MKLGKRLCSTAGDDIWGRYWRCVCALCAASSARATGVPIGGFLPLVGIGLTNEFETISIRLQLPAQRPSGILLGQGGRTLRHCAAGHGCRPLAADGAGALRFQDEWPLSRRAGRLLRRLGDRNWRCDGSFFGTINDPVGLYAGGLQGVTGTSPLDDQPRCLGRTNQYVAGDASRRIRLAEHCWA